MVGTFGHDETQSSAKSIVSGPILAKSTQNLPKEGKPIQPHKDVFTGGVGLHGKKSGMGWQLLRDFLSNFLPRKLFWER